MLLRKRTNVHCYSFTSLKTYTRRLVKSLSLNEVKERGSDDKLALFFVILSEEKDLIKYLCHSEGALHKACPEH